MSTLYYNESKCEHCHNHQSGKCSYPQKIILVFLLSLFLIPGLIYFFIVKPTRCKICGLGLNNKHLAKNLFYNECVCENCKINQGSAPYWNQIFLFIFLCSLFIIPGLVYFFLAKPKCCFKCGIKLDQVHSNSQTHNLNQELNSYKQEAIVESNICNESIQSYNCNNLINNRHKEVKKSSNKFTPNELISLVEVRNLTKKYKSRPTPAINNISFDIYGGHFHAFIGANGAGKTTTIKSIISAYSKSKYSGSIKIGGYENESVDAHLLLGYIPEEAKFPKKMTTKNYLIKMSMLSGKSLSESKKIAQKILNDTKLESVANVCPNSFSSGQKKKVLLAQALINDPKVLIMDEPAANLDPLAREDLFETLVNLQKQGKAIFLSSHILDEVTKYATFVTILDGGKIVYNGPIDSKTDLKELYLNYVKLGSVDSGIMK